MLYAQEGNALKGKTGPIIIATKCKDPIISMDGLILSKTDYQNLKIDESYSKKFKIKVLSEKEAKRKYKITNKDGVVEIKTNLLYVLNGECLTSKNISVLSKVTQTDILDIKLLKKDDAIKKYGKSGRNGALIIKTK